MVKLELWDHKGLLVRKGCKEKLVQWGLRAHKGYKVFQVKQELLELLALKVKREPQGQLVPKDQWEKLESLALLDLKGQQGKREPHVLWEN
jgi:hypothetical protein